MGAATGLPPNTPHKHSIRPCDDEDIDDGDYGDDEVLIAFDRFLTGAT